MMTPMTSTTSPRPPISSPSNLLTNITKCFGHNDTVLDQNDALNVKAPASTSSSHQTAPTAPITTSTSKHAAASAQQSLSLKTGMSEAQDGDTSHRTVAGSSNNNNNANIRSIWSNFNVRCADSLDHNSECNESLPTATNSQSKNGSSPTEQLINQSTIAAKAAVEAASSVYVMMESLSSRLTSHASNRGLTAVPFCGRTDDALRKKSTYYANTMDNNMMGIPEEEPENDDNDNILYCGPNNGCFPQQFEYNPFRDHGSKKSSTSHWNDNATSKSRQDVSVDKRGAASETAGRAATTQNEFDTNGYEIRLKSTFSQQQTKMQREQGENNALNNHADESSHHWHKVDETKTMNPAFSKTHPNVIRMNHQTNEIPINSDDTANNASSLPIKYLSIPTAITPNITPNTTPDSTTIKRTVSEVSELTMRSHAERYSHIYSSNNRRMAYYAVGQTAANEKNGKNGGGNRRCYFTGVGIGYGDVFYAGSVMQGPRTLVVFCLPSALGLPTLHPNHTSYSPSDKTRYLSSLPEPNAELLNEMKQRYPDPFGSLPVQVQSPNCWKLYIKFCFFSGLPIAEGDLHYRVKSDVTALRIPNESIPEISLSQEVMEAVNGEESAEILRLPNQKTFDYLRRQYSQQSEKLCGEVFDRKSWEMVRPEV